MPKTLPPSPAGVSLPKPRYRARGRAARSEERLGAGVTGDRAFGDINEDWRNLNRYDFGGSFGLSIRMKVNQGKNYIELAGRLHSGWLNVYRVKRYSPGGAGPFFMGYNNQAAQASLIYQII